jgi:hypothetical protein
MAFPTSQRIVRGRLREGGDRAGRAAGRTSFLSVTQIVYVKQDSHSQADFSLLTTNVPFKPERVESQTPVEEEYPTHDPARLTLGGAHARQSEVEGPVQVVQAGEQLTISLDSQM